jgi:protocatechuate 3,4-dioxygenase alpha subunit
MSLQPSTSQTFGPYFHIGLRPHEVAIPAGATVITLTGRVLDGAGKPVADAMLETWQADPAGRYPVPEQRVAPPEKSQFGGLGRTPTDPDGRFRIRTYKPGAVAAPGGGLQAPHILVLIGMRGLLRHLVTRVYFPDASALAADPVLALVPAERRATLIARPGGKDELLWDVQLQGERETVFFDC